MNTKLFNKKFSLGLFASCLAVFFWTTISVAAPPVLPEGPVYFQYNNLEQVDTSLANGIPVPGGGIDIDDDGVQDTPSAEGNWGVFNISTIQQGAIATENEDINGGPVFFFDDGPGGSFGQVSGVFYGISTTSPTTSTDGWLDFYWQEAGSDTITNTDLNGTGLLPANRTAANSAGKFTNGVLLARLAFDSGILPGDTVTHTVTNIDITAITGNGRADSFANVVDVNNDGKIDEQDGAWAPQLDGDWFYVDDDNDGIAGEPGETRDVRFSTFFNLLASWDDPLSAENGIVGLRSNDPGRVYVVPPEPCIDLEKEVSVDGGQNWFDADVLGDAPVTGLAATYRLIVENCGDIPLTGVTLTDIDPTSSDPETVVFTVTIDDLQPGDRKVIEAFLIADIAPDGTYSNITPIDGFEALNAPDRCNDPWRSVDGSSEGEYLNTAQVTTNEGVSDDDPAWVVCEEQVAGNCRMTGGSVTINEFIDEEGVTRVFYTYVDDTYADAVDGKITGNTKKLVDGTATWVTTGGQIGAPSTDNNPKNGHWTHTQHAGAEGIFTFQSGTASAPPGTEISNIDCADPGWCVQARCAPFKQIFWDGIGYFANKHGGEDFNASFPDTACTVTPGGPQKEGTLHYYHAMVGDFGDNGKNDRQPDNSDCDWPAPSSYNVDEYTPIDAVLDDQFGDKGGQVCDKCADYYQIQIFCGASEATKGEVIYTFEDFIDNGNFQLHPETSEQCTVDLF